MKHLLLACSSDKLNVSVPIPALERYNGPAYKSLRLHFADHPEDRLDLSIGIISAKFGFIHAHTLIPRYDQRMTADRAEIFRQVVPEQIHAWLAGPNPETGLFTPPDIPIDYPLYELQMNGGSDEALEAEAFADSIEDLRIEEQVEQIEADSEYKSPDLFVMLGRDYHPIITPESAWLPEGMSIFYSSGSIAMQRVQLVAWLRNRPIPGSKPKQDRGVKVNTGQEPVRSRLSGELASHTKEEVIAIVEELLQDPEEVKMSKRTRRWVAEVGEYKVAPKWLVSRLIGKHTSTFDAGEARRVLAQLEITCVEHASNPLI